MNTSDSLLFRLPTRKFKRVVYLSVLIILLQPKLPLVWAHSALDDCIHHRIRLEVDANNIDITVELFFHAHRSEEERWLMDEDFDGRITSGEIREYLRHSAGRFKKGLQLSIDGRPLRVVPLYAPDLKLHNTHFTENHPHELRLYYFARTPKWLQPGSIITLRDNLWKSSPAICSLSVRGKGNCRLAVEDRAASPLSPHNFGGHRQMQIRSLEASPLRSSDYPHETKCGPNSDSSSFEKDGFVHEVSDTLHKKRIQEDPATQKSGESQ
jgi:hypothetical protein